MKRSEVSKWLKENKIVAVDFYLSLDGEDANDTHFGICEISGVRGALAKCVALEKSGERFEINVGEWLIGGPLGSLMGAF